MAWPTFRIRAAVCAAGAAMATLSVGIPPAAFADGQWGSIAISQDGKRGYYVTNYTSQSDAESRVVQMCYYPRPANQAPPCNVVISFSDCGAVAQSGTQYAGGTGATQQDAEQAALNQLAGSTIRKSACNDGGSSMGGPA